MEHQRIHSEGNLMNVISAERLSDGALPLLDIRELILEENC